MDWFEAWPTTLRCPPRHGRCSSAYTADSGTKRSCSAAFVATPAHICLWGFTIAGRKLSRNIAIQCGRDRRRAARRSWGRAGARRPATGDRGPQPAATLPLRRKQGIGRRPCRQRLAPPQPAGAVPAPGCPSQASCGWQDPSSRRPGEGTSCRRLRESACRAPPCPRAPLGSPGGAAPWRFRPRPTRPPHRALLLWPPRGAFRGKSAPS